MREVHLWEQGNFGSEDYGKKEETRGRGSRQSDKCILTATSWTESLEGKSCWPDWEVSERQRSLCLPCWKTQEETEVQGDGLGGEQQQNNSDQLEEAEQHTQTDPGSTVR